MIAKWLEHFRVRRILKRFPIPHETWHVLMTTDPLFHGLTAVEKARLREMATVFLHRKYFKGAQGQVVTPDMGAAISAQAALLVLNLGLDTLDGCNDIIVYPSAFRVRREAHDELGLVRQEDNVLAGESWSYDGPVVLAWDEAEAELSENHPGHNVVLHEFAHKLDMLNGKANGMPPLHAEMNRAVWTQTFSQAFEHLQAQLAHFHNPDINPYAATSPAEFFAVTTEYFFTAPKRLKQHFPGVYEQLKQYYRQDTLRREQAADSGF
jgi:Mlc titration factor MtfA (ptsG expression regulator)